MLGGTIDLVSSRSGKGSTFTLTPAGHEAAMTARRGSDPLVLLVDDYPDAREMYAEYLQFSGFDVVEAANGIEALERAVDSRPTSS